jgi:hypothetical protein
MATEQQQQQAPEGAESYQFAADISQLMSLISKFWNNLKPFHPQTL